MQGGEVMSAQLFHVQWDHHELKVEVLAVQELTTLNVVLSLGQKRRLVKHTSLDKFSDQWSFDIWTLHADRVDEYQERVRSRAVLSLEQELERVERILRKASNDPFRIIEPEVRA